MPRTKKRDMEGLWASFALPLLPEVQPFYLVTHRALRHVPRVAAVMDYIAEVSEATGGFARRPPEGV